MTITSHNMSGIGKVIAQHPHPNPQRIPFLEQAYRCIARHTSKYARLALTRRVYV